MKVDNTMLKLFQDCPLKYFTRIEEQWTGRFRSGALGYGGAVHEGLKAWYQGSVDGLPPVTRMENALEAIKANPAWDSQPVDDYRTLARAQELMIKYIKEYTTESFKILQVEVPFKFELGRWILNCKDCGHDNSPFCRPENDWIATSVCENCDKSLEPIEYGGIFDTLVQYGHGSQSVVYILEHKTTSQLGPMYFKQYDLDNQITGYIWGAQMVSGKVIGGALVNAMCTTSSGKMSFARQMVSRTAADLERWKNDVADTCNEIDKCKRLGHWRMHTNQCMGKYGQCEYQSVHILSNPEEQRRRLETDYRKEEWNFEKRDDVGVAT